MEAWVALFTFGLLIVAAIQAGIYVTQHNSVKTIERAYVDMSPRGLTNLGPNKPPKLQIGIKNQGKTPADIFGVACDIRIANTLPHEFPKDIYPKKREWFFLNPQEVMNWTQDEPYEVISGDTYNTIASGGLTLWVLGYVDYRDRFGRRFRSRFARRLDRDKIQPPSDNALAELFKPKSIGLSVETAERFNFDYEISEYGEPRNPNEWR